MIQEIQKQITLVVVLNILIHLLLLMKTIISMSVLEEVSLRKFNEDLIEEWFVDLSPTTDNCINSTPTIALSQRWRAANLCQYSRKQTLCNQCV